MLALHCHNNTAIALLCVGCVPAAAPHLYGKDGCIQRLSKAQDEGITLLCQHMACIAVGSLLNGFVVQQQRLQAAMQAVVTA